jgi:hypothetical protein
MTYHITLRYFSVDVLRIVPFVLHHEPSDERDLEFRVCVLMRLLQTTYVDTLGFSIPYHSSVDYDIRSADNFVG